MKKVTMIMALGPKGELGNKGGLPWPRHDEDMRRFQAHTIGHPIIMGRKTWESLGGPLRYRQNIVITSDRATISKMSTLAEPAPNLDEALRKAQDEDVYIIGGSQTYLRALGAANRLLITQMHHHFEADTYYKVPFMEDWSEIRREEYENGDPVQRCTFLEYVRRR